MGGLRRGAAGSAGWVALSQLLLEDGAAQAALDAAKQGLRYVAQREHLGKECMAGALLLLRLLAGRCLLAMGRLDEAQVGVGRGSAAGAGDHSTRSAVPRASCITSSMQLLL